MAPAERGQRAPGVCARLTHPIGHCGGGCLELRLRREGPLGPAHHQWRSWRPRPSPPPPALARPTPSTQERNAWAGWGRVGSGGAGEPVGTSAEGMKRPPVPHGPGGWVLAPEFLHSTSIKGEMLATIPLRTRTRQSFPLSLLQHVLEVPALGPFLVSLGCWNKAPRTFIFCSPGGRKSKAKAPAGRFLRRALLPGRSRLSSPCFLTQQRASQMGSLRAHPVRALMPPREPHPHALV